MMEIHVVDKVRIRWVEGDKTNGDVEVELQEYDSGVAIKLTDFDTEGLWDTYYVSLMS